MKRPVLHNYRLVGTNNWYYSRSLLTAESVKADLVGSEQCGAAGWLVDDIYGCLWDAGNGWYASDALGWVWFTGNWAYSTSLKHWLGRVGASRTLWSPQFRWLTLSRTDRYRAESSAIGPILLGMRKPITVLQQNSSVDAIVTMATITAASCVRQSRHDHPPPSSRQLL